MMKRIIQQTLMLAFCTLVNASLAVADDQLPCKNCDLEAVDWTTLPSTYTHRQGESVDQFNASVQPEAVSDQPHLSSVYRNSRSSLQGGNSADHYNRVDQYGPPVRPYGEWRYPNRPFAVPYPGWGPQLPQVYSNFNANNNGLNNGNFGGNFRGNAQPGGLAPANGGAGFGGFGGFGNANGYGVPSGYGYGNGPFTNPNYQSGIGGSLYPNSNSNLLPGPGNVLSPLQDEFYPDAPGPIPLSDRDFFRPISP